jgi:hypothetical protein
MGALILFSKANGESASVHAIRQRDAMNNTRIRSRHGQIAHHCVLSLLVVTLLSVALSSCAIHEGGLLKIEETNAIDMTGTYTLFLYGCRYPDDVENVAILDKDGDPYTLEIFAPDFRFKTIRGLPAADALRRAEQFVRCSVHYQQTRISKITDTAGRIVGYEARALYSPIRFGMYDVLDIRYVRSGKKITIYITLDPAVEELLRGDDGHIDRDRK